jgi:hypothetical protein
MEVDFLDKDEAAIDHLINLEDLEDMQEELDYMMEEEGMTVDIRAMMEEMHRSGVLMDDHDEGMNMRICG